MGVSEYRERLTVRGILLAFCASIACYLPEPLILNGRFDSVVERTRLDYANVQFANCQVLACSQTKTPNPWKGGAWNLVKNLFVGSRRQS